MICKRLTVMPKSITQLVRYGMVGILSNLLGYTIFCLITYWGVEPKKAMTILYLVGVSVGFFGNKRLVFANQNALLSTGFRYGIAHFGGYLLNLLMLFIFVDRLGYSYTWVQVVAVFVVSGFLFITFKYFVFATNACHHSEYVS